MSISLVNSTSANTADNSTLVLPVPTGTSAGQLMIMQWGSNGVPPAPDGWILLPLPVVFNPLSSSLNTYLAYRYANSSEPSSYTIGPGYEYMSGGIVTLSGTQSYAPIDVFSAIGSFPEPPTALSVNTSIAGEYLLAGGGLQGGGGNGNFLAAPISGSWTQLWNNEFNSGIYYGSGMFGRLFASNGATGNVVFGANNQLVLAWQIAILPASNTFPVVNTSQANTSVANGSVVITSIPTGTVNGQLMVAYATYRDSDTISAPSGWSLFSNGAFPYGNPWNSGLLGGQSAVFYKYANSTEPSMYTWSFSANDSAAAVGIVTLDGTVNTSPLDSANQGNSSSIPVGLSVNASQANDYILYFASGGVAPGWFPSPTSANLAVSNLFSIEAVSGFSFGGAAFGGTFTSSGTTGNTTFGSNSEQYGITSLAILMNTGNSTPNNSIVTQTSSEMAWNANSSSTYDHVTQTSGEMAWHGSSISVQDHITQDSVELAWQQIVRERVTQDSVEIAWEQIVRTHITQDSIELAYNNIVIEPNVITSNTFLIGDLVTQIEPYNNGIVQSVTAQITIPGSNTFYELGKLLITGVDANSLSNAQAQGILDAIVQNIGSNTTVMYLSNTTGIFVNTDTDVVGLYARNFNIDFIQRMDIGFVANADPITGSFSSEDFETITDNTTGATGGVSGANSSTIDVVIDSGMFDVGDFITGSTSNATAQILSFSGTAFNNGDLVAQESQVIQLVNVKNPANTGSFQVGEIVYQQQKNFRSANAITQNTMVGIIDTCNATVATMSSEFGLITNNAILIGSNSGCIATINNVKITNTATGVVYSSNSTTIQITAVVGEFMLGHVIYGPNSYANLTGSLANIYSISPISAAINNLDVVRGTGQFVATTDTPRTFIVDANTEAQGNIIYIVMTGQ